MKRYITVLLAATVAACGFAQTTTLKECIERGLENSYQIKQAFS